MTGYPKSNTLHGRGKSSGPGWAAFSLMHKAEGLESDSSTEPFPTLASSSPIMTSGLAGYHRQSKSFSSVVRTAIQSTPLIDEHLTTIDRTDLVNVQVDSPTARLRNAHSWADVDLIRDVLAAANNDDSLASDILRGMASLDSSTEQKDPPEPSNLLNGEFSEKESEGFSDMGPLVVEEPYYNNSVLSKQPLDPLIEPELEETDDDYLNLRKDAIKMMRAASQHSKAASNAYMRGDHTSARQLSAKAQSEWLAANTLNFEAAEEIVRIRNHGNDMGSLDLHGLHASEAVAVLKQHLLKIESIQCADSLNRTSKFTFKNSPSNGNETKSLVYGKPELKGKKPSNVHVITGTGNHSNGEAILPTAIKSFLIDNKYRFEEARPGVFAVWPKFRWS